MMSLIVLSGWIAAIAFIGMIATCVCFYGCQHRLAKKTKTKLDDYIVSRMHMAHKWFVMFAIIAISAHIILSVFRIRTVAMLLGTG